MPSCLQSCGLDPADFRQELFGSTFFFRNLLRAKNERLIFVNHPLTVAHVLVKARKRVLFPANPNAA
jgi:hypothetical protein